MKAIVVVSPFRASQGRSLRFHKWWAEELCLAAARAGYAPFAPHLFCPSFLDENLPEDRDLGIDIGKEWIARSDEVWVWDVWGISSGMKAEIEWAGAVARSYEPKRPLILYYSKGGIPEWMNLAARRDWILP